MAFFSKGENLDGNGPNFLMEFQEFFAMTNQWKSCKLSLCSFIFAQDLTDLFKSLKLAHTSGKGESGEFIMNVDIKISYFEFILHEIIESKFNAKTQSDQII